MPNTIAHIAVNGFGTRALIKDADAKWIYLGVIIPDFPWIIQRVVQTIYPSVNPFDLRIYAVIQATFFLTLILALAISLLSKDVMRKFLILSLGAFLHLLLDSLQTKWGNGVHFLAPLSWEMTNFNLFFPENFFTYFLIIIGIIFYALYWNKSVKTPTGISFSFKKIISAFLVYSVYMIIPFFLFSGPVSNNNHYLQTLINKDERAGKYIEFDRARYVYENGEGYLLPYFNEKIYLQNFDMKHSGKVSIKGKFIDENKVEVLEFHQHYVLLRDILSYIGIVMILLVWIFAAINEKRLINKYNLSAAK